MRIDRGLYAALAALLLAAPAAAQQYDTTRKVDVSGVLYANYQYRADDAARSANKFDLERVYVNVRAPLGSRASMRFTADVFQQQKSPDDAYYRGWTVRAKYAYLQYDYLRPTASGMSAFARLGMLNTVVIEHIEGFWPRWISTVPTDRFGFFSSADMGASTQLTLPNKLGEVYATVTNGPGYSSRETDRFKDYAARLTLTPLANQDGIAKSLTLTAWGYKGALASKFVDGGAGQVGQVSTSLQRDRWGVFAGLRDRRLTLGAEYAERRDEGETGANTAASPRVVSDSTGRIVSGFAIVRPFEIANPEKRSPLALLFRVDRIEPSTDRGGSGRLVIGGLMYDLTSRLSLSLDYQEQLPRDGAAIAPSKTYFLHASASF
ncbi:MAG TPA: hypothetical protein VFS05_07760 [Gemmatimonadaceae bacterium]|nr:hypothetical protein [Gemmatimonadaceae bacterium]